MNPKYPVYIVSKGRAESRLTSKSLEAMSVSYQMIIEEQEYEEYAAVIDPAKLLVLDPAYQHDYDAFDDLGDAKSKGPGPARNFAWDHALRAGAGWHWVMDDNIWRFTRLHENRLIKLADGGGFAVMEAFCNRYENVGMAGPNYEMFSRQRAPSPPFTLNTRIYSCNLIRNDVAFRWRGRYNEDTDISLRLLQAGWCTVQFNAFLQAKTGTQRMRGGNTAEFYAKEGTLQKSRMLVQMHPHVTRLVWKFGRWHHQVDYRPFKANRLRRRTDIEIPTGVNEYGMTLVRRATA